MLRSYVKFIGHNTNSVLFDDKLQFPRLTKNIQKEFLKYYSKVLNESLTILRRLLGGPIQGKSLITIIFYIFQQQILSNPIDNIIQFSFHLEFQQFSWLFYNALIPIVTLEIC